MELVEYTVSWWAGPYASKLRVLKRYKNTEAPKGGRQCCQGWCTDTTTCRSPRHLRDHLYNQLHCEKQTKPRGKPRNPVKPVINEFFYWVSIIYAQHLISKTSSNLSSSWKNYRFWVCLFFPLSIHLPRGKSEMTRAKGEKKKKRKWERGLREEASKGERRKTERRTKEREVPKTGQCTQG